MPTATSSREGSSNGGESIPGSVLALQNGKSNSNRSASVPHHLLPMSQDLAIAEAAGHSGGGGSGSHRLAGDVLHTSQHVAFAMQQSPVGSPVGSIAKAAGVSIGGGAAQRTSSLTAERSSERTSGNEDGHHHAFPHGISPTALATMGSGKSRRSSLSMVSMPDGAPHPHLPPALVVSHQISDTDVGPESSGRSSGRNSSVPGHTPSARPPLPPQPHGLSAQLSATSSSPDGAARVSQGEDLDEGDLLFPSLDRVSLAAAGGRVSPAPSPGNTPMAAGSPELQPPGAVAISAARVGSLRQPKQVSYYSFSHHP